MRQSYPAAHLNRKDTFMPLRNGLLLYILITAGFPACKDAFGGLESKQTAISAANEIVVICDKNLWEGPVGDSVIYYFEAPYPIMPQPEPMFDIRHFTTEDLIAAPLRRELRTYLIVANLNDPTSETTRLVMSDLGEEKLRRAREDKEYFTTAGTDKWARSQLIMYVFGFGVDDLAAKVVRAYPALARRIAEHDQPLIDAATYLSKESFPIAKRIQEKFNVSMKIPGDYRIAVDENNFLWIRQDFDEAISNITIMRFPYENAAQFELEGMVTMRDRMGLMVQGSTIGSFMVTNTEDLPVYLYKKEVDGRYTVEARGTWELTQDFLGGPFVTYAIADSNEILMIDAFVHAPGKEKRNYVQRMERIIASLKF
jgi:hypothetical protein